MAKFKRTREPRRFNCTLDDGSAVWLTVRDPDRQELEAADLELSAVFNRCLMHGLPTRARMLRQLKANGLWSADMESEMIQLRNEGLELEKRLDTADSFKTDEGRDQAKQRYNEILGKLQAFRQDIDTMLGHTADAKADEARRDMLLACTIEYASHDDQGNRVNGDHAGQRVWASLEGVYNEADQRLLERAYYEHSMFTSGVESEWDALTGIQAQKKGQADQQAQEPPPAAPAAPTDLPPPAAVAPVSAETPVVPQ